MSGYINPPSLQGTDGVNLSDAHNGSQGFESHAAALSHLQNIHEQ